MLSRTSRQAYHRPCLLLATVRSSCRALLALNVVCDDGVLAFLPAVQFFWWWATLQRKVSTVAEWHGCMVGLDASMACIVGSKSHGVWVVHQTANVDVMTVVGGGPGARGEAVLCVQPPAYGSHECASPLLPHLSTLTSPTLNSLSQISLSLSQEQCPTTSSLSPSSLAAPTRSP